MKKRSLFLALAWMAVLGGVGSAQAGQIIQTFTHGSDNYTYTAFANQFNPLMGTLNSVVITLTSDITGAVNVININSTPEAYMNAASAVPVGVTGPGGLALSATATTPAQSGTIAAAPSPGSFTQLTLPGETVTASVSTTVVAPNLAPYIGTGTNDLAFMFSGGQGTFSGSAAFGVFFGGSATADAKIQVVYNFTAAAVPEPASMGLLGIGMAGFFAFRRFFDKRAAKV